MRLDMYLSKKTYVKVWSHRKPEDQFEVNVNRGGKVYDKIQPKRVSYVVEELMYWRKANQIHGWFVDNTEAIESDVRHYVTKQNLEELLKVCEKVLDILNKSTNTEIFLDCADEIMELLPPTEGFFFGSELIDEYYENNIEKTVEFLKNELPNCEDGDDFEYLASW